MGVNFVELKLVMSRGVIHNFQPVVSNSDINFNLILFLLQFYSIMLGIDHAVFREF